MKTFLIQRNLTGAGLLTASEKKSIARRSLTVIDELGSDKLQWIHSYITQDNLWCVYRAINPDILRQHAEKGPFPLDGIREIFGLMSPATAEIETVSKSELKGAFKNVKALFAAVFLLLVISFGAFAQTTVNMRPDEKKLYMDVHTMTPGKVKFEDVAEAHKKDLATQGRHNVEFIKYWVDEKNGLVYCLSSAKDSASVVETHTEAHGLVPSRVYEVKSGQETPKINPENLYLDVHYLEPGKVTVQDVEAAHQKDLATEGKHNVKFINYWVDEKEGVVMCLSQAPNANAVSETHKEAHGLIPASVAPVKEGK